MQLMPKLGAAPESGYADREPGFISSKCFEPIFYLLDGGLFRVTTAIQPRTGQCVSGERLFLPTFNVSSYAAPPSSPRSAPARCRTRARRPTLRDGQFFRNIGSSDDQYSERAVAIAFLLAAQTRLGSSIETPTKLNPSNNARKQMPLMSSPESMT